jgi:hypothetical protein
MHGNEVLSVGFHQVVNDCRIRQLTAERDDLQAKVKGYQHHLRACEQAAGKALGYPWFKDDQANFPGATEADGVCVGEHVGETIVESLAQQFTALQAELAEVKGELAFVDDRLSRRPALDGTRAERIDKMCSMNGKMADANTNMVRECESLRTELTTANATIAELRKALETIKQWQDFPTTHPFTGKSLEYTYAFHFGSNGERDYMRGIAAAALSTAPPASEGSKALGGGR